MGIIQNCNFWLVSCFLIHSHICSLGENALILTNWTTSTGPNRNEASGVSVLCVCVGSRYACNLSIPGIGIFENTLNDTNSVLTVEEEKKFYYTERQHNDYQLPSIFVKNVTDFFHFMLRSSVSNSCARHLPPRAYSAITVKRFFFLGGGERGQFRAKPWYKSVVVSKTAATG